MTRDPVLLKAEARFIPAVRKLLIAAEFEPVTKIPHHGRVHLLFRQLPRSAYQEQPAAPIQETVARIQKVAAKTRERYPGHITVFFAPDMQADQFVAVVSELHRRPGRWRIDLASNAPEAVAWLIRNAVPERRFVLDQVDTIDSFGDDLRDDITGRLDAKKVCTLFDIKLGRIAEAVGVTRQTLDENPTSEKAQPLLRLFERVARFRAHPQIKDAAALRKWFRRPLPMFSGHPAEELFQAGKLDLVAEKVDQLLTGDFGG